MRANVAIALLSAATAATSAYDPVADAAAQVDFGSMRITLLSPSLVRFEVSHNASLLGFDDRATLAVVYRRLPVPAFTATKLNASAISVTTAVLDIVYVDGGSGGNACADAEAGTDALSPVRSPAFPEGATVASQAACCALCASDAACRAWVWDSVDAPPKLNCYPLASLVGRQAVPGRTLGDSGGSLPSGASLSVTYPAPAGGTATWQPASKGRAESEWDVPCARLLLDADAVQRRVRDGDARRPAVSRWLGRCRRHEHRALRRGAGRARGHPHVVVA